MEEGSNMASHLDKFDELVVSMGAVGDVMDEARLWTVLLGSLPNDIENAQSISLVEVKEKLLRAFEKIQRQETSEGAFRAGQKHKTGPMSKKEGNTRKKQDKSRGKCFRCNKVGHKQDHCTKGDEQSDSEIAFRATQQHCDGWLLDSGASSHMTPELNDFSDYQVLQKPIEIVIADGATMKAVGKGTVRFRCKSDKPVTIMDVLHIPSLDRRLLSLSKVTTRGMEVRFGQTHCVILKGKEEVLTAKRQGSVYTLRVMHEHAMFAAYEGMVACQARSHQL
ncbi:TPA: hypothetical protein N0F65_003813 [Lagenidium giganteum]|uniref:CCHC-type domain-containing protein n=1 Tax=Lagenidium giganteum TaxID=4803 RepID=A0AAV2Z044_9STRA|nr:TPA: hypothetical protein N0F65_003813 [Lagenidium giganteum]